jgi:lipid-A-disaccharide synthase-like uncharacterized protein
VSAWLPLVLAFQVFDAVGWLGQGLFVLRMVVQWWASERAKAIVVPRAFWTLSLAGTIALLVYQWHRKDPVFLAGVSINLAIYVRNLVMLSREGKVAPRGRSAWPPLLLGLLAFTVLAVAARDHLAFDTHPVWLAFGFAFQAIWSSRFVVQWILSERRGRSHLPASFFWLSIVGSIGLCVYAIHQVDWVMMFAMVLNPVPYARNLMLMHKARQA